MVREYLLFQAEVKMGYDYEYYLLRNRLEQQAFRKLKHKHLEEFNELFEELKEKHKLSQLNKK